MHDLTLVVLLGSILVLPGSGTCQPCLLISHRPDGKSADTHALTFCLLFAGRRCLCPGWHSGHLMVHHQWEHSHRWRSARSCSKVPIALMVEDSHFARCLQGGVFVYGATVTIDSCTISRNNAAETNNVRQRPATVPMPGDLLTRLPQLSLGNCGPRSGQLQYVRATETSNITIAPMGKPLTRLPRFSHAKLRPTRFDELQFVRAAET
jgi:hypothetical protein